MIDKGSFDFGCASLREALPTLGMTGPYLPGSSIRM
jgi:hypothetical protein